MSINSRIAEFIKYLGISTRKFYKANGLSDGALNSKEMGAEKVSGIIEKYRNSHGLNSDWLLFGSGDMISKQDFGGQLGEEKVNYQISGSIDKMVDRKIDMRLNELQKQISVIVETQEVVIDKIFDEGLAEVQRIRTNRREGKNAN